MRIVFFINIRAQTHTWRHLSIVSGINSLPPINSEDGLKALEVAIEYLTRKEVS